MYTTFGNQSWITPFGLIFVLAIFASWWLGRRRAAATGIDRTHIDLVLPLAFVAGIAGAAILAALTPMDAHLAGHMMQTELRIRLFGMLAGGVLLIFVYCRISRLSFRSMLDVLAVPAALWLCLHRVGCLLAGCCWGDISVYDSEFAAQSTTLLELQVQTLPWLTGDWVLTAVQYPPGSMPYEQQLLMGLISSDADGSLPVHPVQLYESAVLGLILLMTIRIPIDRYAPGSIAVLVFSCYAVLRFLLEFLRADGNIVVSIFTATQFHCIALLGISWLGLRVYQQQSFALKNTR